MSNPTTAPQVALWRRAAAEFLGTGLLVAIVIGSGIAAQTLSTDAGLQLLENSIATALGLGVLIVMLAPVSGAHFNSAVSLADLLAGRSNRTGLSPLQLGVYIAAQVMGAIAGAVLANAMFAVPTSISTTDRATPATLLAEVVATAGLVLLILALVRAGHGPLVIGPAVGAYIGAAYWFTSSTSFANPAVTLGRIFSDTFAGIAPASVIPFVGAQLVGATAGLGIAFGLLPQHTAAR